MFLGKWVIYKDISYLISVHARQKWLPLGPRNLFQHAVSQIPLSLNIQ